MGQFEGAGRKVGELFGEEMQDVDRREGQKVINCPGVLAPGTPSMGAPALKMAAQEKGRETGT